MHLPSIVSRLADITSFHRMIFTAGRLFLTGGMIFTAIPNKVAEKKIMDIVTTNTCTRGLKNKQSKGISRSCYSTDQYTTIKLHSLHSIQLQTSTMRFTILTTLALVGISMAATVWTLSTFFLSSYLTRLKIPSGGACKKDGSMGTCASNLCVVCFERPLSHQHK